MRVTEPITTLSRVAHAILEVNPRDQLDCLEAIRSVMEESLIPIECYEVVEALHRRVFIDRKLE